MTVPKLVGVLIGEGPLQVPQDDLEQDVLLPGVEGQASPPPAPGGQQPGFRI